ncbi:MAG: hypothetical protein ACRD26_05815 [Vicinamibacterales bacterium]
MQRSTFFVCEIVAFIVRDKVHDCALRERRWLVKNETSLFDSRS